MIFRLKMNLLTVAWTVQLCLGLALYTNALPLESGSVFEKFATKEVLIESKRYAGHYLCPRIRSYINKQDESVYEFVKDNVNDDCKLRIEATNDTAWYENGWRQIIKVRHLATDKLIIGYLEKWGFPTFRIISRLVDHGMVTDHEVTDEFFIDSYADEDNGTTTFALRPYHSLNIGCYKPIDYDSAQGAHYRVESEWGKPYNGCVDLDYRLIMHIQ